MPLPKKDSLPTAGLYWHTHIQAPCLNLEQPWRAISVSELPGRLRPLVRLRHSSSFLSTRFHFPYSLTDAVPTAPPIKFPQANLHQRKRFLRDSNYYIAWWIVTFCKRVAFPLSGSITSLHLLTSGWATSLDWPQKCERKWELPLMSRSIKSRQWLYHLYFHSMRCDKEDIGPVLQPVLNNKEYLELSPRHPTTDMYE